MKNKYGKLNLTIQYVLIFAILLLAANIILSVVILNQSKSAMQVLIRKDMLDISNTAAGSLDGDVLGALTEADVDGPVFREIEAKLNVFKDNTDIEYIYAVRQVGPEEFIFTVDPDPIDPGKFGETIIVSDAMISAGKGVASVDAEPIQDRWGNFYSAYSPVFDSKGKVAGVVGIDFNVYWYDDQIRSYNRTVSILTILTTLLGVAIVAFMTNRITGRFRKLDTELSSLASDVDGLTETIGQNKAYLKSIGHLEANEEPAGEETMPDEISALGAKIRSMQKEMHLYLEYLNVQAYTDALTGVGNTTAYQDAITSLDAKIVDGTADFAVAVFDINDLKGINDNYGHAVGDSIIKDAGRCISAVFGNENTYRIGGDEFCAIAEGLSEEEIEEAIAKIDRAIRITNGAKRPAEAKVSISNGTSRLDPNRDFSFHEVFVRADETMYNNKRAYYANGNDRRTDL